MDENPTIATNVKKIGKFTLLEEISRGGMGVVFRGIDEQLNRPLAIKMLPKEFFTNQEQKDRFLLEARIVAKLDHPNIMKVYSIEYAEDTVWIVMELLDGQLLSALIKDHASLTIEQTANIIDQLCKALSYSHSKGIIHRDIKPANVMVNKDNIVKLMDFGIARDTDTDLNLTRAGTIMGTPKYMSPEQFTGQGVDNRSDIYSLGIMVYEMLCGKVPFDGKTIAEIAYKQIHEKPIPIKKLCKKITPELETFVNKSLAKDKKDRLASLAEINFADNKSKIVVKTVRTKVNFLRLVFIYSFLVILILGWLLFKFNSDREKELIKQAEETSKLVEQKKNKTIELIKQSEELLKSNDWASAEVKLNLAKQNDPKNPDIESKFKILNDLKTIALNAQKAKSLFANALNMLSEESNTNSSNLLQEAITLDPNNKEKYETEFNEKLNALNKFKSTKYYDTAITNISNNEFSEALEALKKAIELDPKNSKFYLTFAEILEEQSQSNNTPLDYTLYCGYLEKSLLLDPNNEPRWNKLALAYNTNNQKQKAIDTCKRGLGYFNNSAQLQNNLKVIENSK